MKLQASEPVTILASRVDRRYIPQMAVLPHSVLRLNIGVGPDNNFTPGTAYHSYDAGRTWQNAPTPVPRIECCTVLSNGSYYEIDDYFFLDPERPGTYVGYAGFSTDGRTFHREFITIHRPSCKPVTLRTMRTFGQPQNPWFEAINEANHHGPVSLDTVWVGGAHITGIQELDSPDHLLAVGYFRAVEGYQKCVVQLFESTNGGRHWEERAVVMAMEDAPEGANEAALVRLDSGQLYVLARTGALLHHCRSTDLGRTWSAPEPVRLVDSGEYITGVMPTVRRMQGGGLIAVYGRPKSRTFTSLEEARAFDYVAEHYGVCGKFVMVDPTGTGRAWQGKVDLHPREVALQRQMGVPADQCLRVQDDGNVRDSNSWEYLTLDEVAPDSFLVAYDVQQFRQHWNAHPINGVRLVRVDVQRD